MPLLATATTQAEETGRSMPKIELVDLIDYFWRNVTGMEAIVAVLLLSVGLVYMLYGWRVFRMLVVISFGFIGMFLGIYVGKWVDNNDWVIWGGIIGMAVFACLSIPLMKWCISVLGAIAGGIITSAVWIALGLSDTYLPAGFVVGFVGGGLISFILLKASVMLFTSLGGSVIMMTGIVSLLYQYEVHIANPPTNHMYDLVWNHSWFLPAALVLPTAIGMLFQHRFIKESPKFEVKDK
jgi:hypothetical protein